jgi:hypothetical protein
MADDWLKEMNSKKMVGGVMLDFRAAFDAVILTYCRGFSSAVLLWIESYLSNRTQRVFINGSLSHANSIE